MLELHQEVNQLTINERIKKIRLDLNLTMEGFGQKIGLKKSAISHMESGKNNPSTQTICSICREFNVRKEWLLYEEGDMYSKVNDSILDELKKTHNLTESDIDVLKAFLNMDESGRKALLVFATQLAQVASTKNTINDYEQTPKKKENA